MLRATANPTTSASTSSTSASTNASTKMKEEAAAPSTATTSPAVLKWLFQLPSLLLLIILSTLLTVQYSYHSYVVPIMMSYKRSEDMTMNFYDDYREEFTYYNRHCSILDISTLNASDLLVSPNMTPLQASDIMLQHGAVAVQNVLTPTTATELRTYLANQHAANLTYNQVFWSEINRLALGLGTHDHPSISKALEEVGNHENLQKTLEGILGPNPAISEISTLTSMSGSDDQYLHSDSDWFGSSLLYGQSFLHSYSLFIALQDTTQALGATTICPGTHYCADEDLAPLCYNNGAFSVSTNGHTGYDQGLLYQGDAFLFNQNIFHGGPGNRDASGNDRIMFILSFVSQKTTTDDLRRQGLGTYYYQRWNMWGHTFEDLKHASKIMVQPWAALRALGLLPAKGITWIHHFAQQLANREDFYADDILLDFHEQILDYYKIPNLLRSPSPQWEQFIPETMEVWVWAFGALYFITTILYIATATVVYVALKESARSKSPFRIRSLLVQHLILALLFYGFVRYHIDRTDLAKSVQTGHVHRRPFDEFTSNSNNLDKLQRPTTLPERNDVLFSARLQEVPYLASFTRFLDYHPGNQQWKSLINTSQQDNKDKNASAVVDQLLQTTDAGLSTRFLRQDVATGYWQIMTYTEALQETERAMGLTPTSLTKDDNVDSSSEEELTCSQRNLSELTESYAVGDKIWAWNDPLETYTEAILTAMDNYGGVYTFQYFIPDEEERLTGQGSPQEDTIRPYVALQSGDRVSVDYHGTGEEFFSGTLLHVHPDGTCSVQCDDGEYIPRVLRPYVLPLYKDTDSENDDENGNDSGEEENEEASNSGDGSSEDEDGEDGEDVVAEE